MWFYQQKTGDLYLNDKLIGTGYSGHEDGLNNPEMQNAPSTGPIPQGQYRILPAASNVCTGPLSMHLQPLTPPTNTFGRSGFMIHGDNLACDHSASRGCIIMGHVIREVIAASTDRHLTVDA